MRRPQNETHPADDPDGNGHHAGCRCSCCPAVSAAEIVLADEATGAPAAQLRADLTTAARWARAYIAQGFGVHPADGDTFNLYDDGAVAEAELLQAMQAAPAAIEPAIAPATLLDDMAAQLRTGEDWAKTDNATAGYEDNVVSWPSVEPADDYTAASLFAFALAGDQGSGLG